MNCRMCNVPAAPHEMTSHGEDKKGLCYPCALHLAEVRIDELERRLATLTDYMRDAVSVAVVAKAAASKQQGGES